ncbi:class I SAM-dependent methyltransferase [Actinomadura luteofluorescens]|uniref:class I SAM-dependent methyltransferase n=1 Tax=Actinomadura luteofluorescens TaxID=46163 RepID=UPI00363BB66B
MDYLLDNRQAEAGVRFKAISELFDPWTFRHMDDAGLRPGWRVWEVGAGGPTVPSWIAGRVGSAGRVLATDIDVSWLADAPELAGTPVEIRRHDLVRDAPPEGPFDLVHARLVLVHLPDRDRALRTMIEALRPGGVLLVEDADPGLQPLACPDEHGPDERLANAVRRGFRALLAERGADLAYGRRSPAPARRRPGGRARRRLLPLRVPRLRRPGDRVHPPGARTAHRGRARHRRGDPPPAGRHRRGAPRPHARAADLRPGPQAR